MAEKNRRSRASFVKKWFDGHPFVRWFGFLLIRVNKNLAVAEMPICVKHCTSSGVVTGGIHAALGNAAGVSLAMMHSEHFTPLTEFNIIGNLKFCRPVKLNDEKLLSEAKFLGVKENRILIQISIKNSVGELKAEGLFEYALLDKPYSS